MVRDELTPEEQIGMHVLLTAHGMSLLNGEDRSSAPIVNVQRAVRWYRDRQHYISALLHDEPLYNAMRVFGRDPKLLDDAGDLLWSRYWTVYDAVTDAILSHRSDAWSRLISDIASAVVSDEAMVPELALPEEFAIRPSP